MGLTDGNWRCDVCGAARPFDEIGVAKHVRVSPDGILVTENVKFCRDNPSCLGQAAVLDHARLALRRAQEELADLREKEFDEIGSHSYLNVTTFVLIAFILGFAIGLAL